MRRVVLAALSAICWAALATAGEPVPPEPPYPMTAAQRAWQKCYASERWCLIDVPDAITKVGTPTAMLTAQKPLYVRRFANRASLLVPCDTDTGRPAVFVSTEKTLTLGEISLRYRVEPQGKTGIALASHMGGGTMFKLQDASAFLDDLKGGTDLTVEIRLASDGSSGLTGFNPTGGEAVLKRLACVR